MPTRSTRPHAADPARVLIPRLWRTTPPDQGGAQFLAEWLAASEPAGQSAADDLVRKTVTALRLGGDAAGFLAEQRQVHLAAMKQLMAVQESTAEVEARIVVDHAIEHLDADLRWLTNAASRLGAAGAERTVRG